MLLRSPFPDIPTQPVRALSVPIPIERRKIHTQKKPINIGFWLRIGGIVFILAIYGTAFILFLPSVLNGAAPTPTITTYQCVHVSLIKTNNNTWITNTDYSCQ